MDKLMQVCVQKVVRMDGGSVGVMSACGAKEKKRVSCSQDMVSPMTL